jgi:hypothetical protein
MGLICSDHFQPGSQVILTMDISPKLTISILAFGGVRVSSGVLKLFFCDVDWVVDIVLLLLSFVRVLNNSSTTSRSIACSILKTHRLNSAFLHELLLVSSSRFESVRRLNYLHVNEMSYMISVFYGGSYARSCSMA